MRSPWRHWHGSQEGSVEDDIPMLEELFRSRGARTILDFGCGAGRHVVYFAKKGFEVYGFDQSQDAVAHAESLLFKEKLSAQLRVWNMTDAMPYERGFFDAVLAVRVIQHTYMKNIESILRDIDRVLRERGFIFLQVPSYENSPIERKTRWVEPGTFITRSGPEKGVTHHFFTKEELLTLLKGYEMLDIHSGTDHYGGYCVLARKPKHPT